MIVMVFAGFYKTAKASIHLMAMKRLFTQKYGWKKLVNLEYINQNDNNTLMN